MEKEQIAGCELIRAYKLLGEKNVVWKTQSLKTEALASGFLQTASEGSVGKFPVTCHDMFKTH